MTADAALPLAPVEHVAEMLCLQADLHWRDTHPGVTATPMNRLLAYLDHEARPCVCVCGHTDAQHAGRCLQHRMSGGSRGTVQQCPCRAFTAGA